MSKVAERVKAREEQNRAAAQAAARAPAVSGDSPPALVDAQHLANAVAANRRELLAEAERIIRSRLDQINFNTWLQGTVRLYFSSDELAVFDVLAWGNERLAQEAARIHTVARQQAIAGTSDERAAARQRLQQASEQRDAEAPRIEEKIRALQQQLHALNREVTAAENEVSKQAAAVAALRKLAPQDAREQYERVKGGINPNKARLSELQARIRQLRELPTIDINTPDGKRKAADLAKHYCPEACAEPRTQNHRGPIIRIPGYHDGSPIKAAEWQAAVDELQAELPELEEQARYLATEIEADARDAEFILDVYSR